MTEIIVLICIDAVLFIINCWFFYTEVLKDKIFDRDKSYTKYYSPKDTVIPDTKPPVSRVGTTPTPYFRIQNIRTIKNSQEDNDLPFKTIGKKRTKYKKRVNKDTIPNIRVTERETCLSYWKSHGWTKRGEKYYGYYNVNDTQIKGRIEEIYNGKYKFWIQYPPILNTSHPHKVCYTLNTQKNGWCEVHFESYSVLTDIDTGIIDIERIQAESLKPEFNKC